MRTVGIMRVAAADILDPSTVRNIARSCTLVLVLEPGVGFATHRTLHRLALEGATIEIVSEQFSGTIAPECTAAMAIHDLLAERVIWYACDGRSIAEPSLQSIRPAAQGPRAAVSALSRPGPSHRVVREIALDDQCGASLFFPLSLPLSAQKVRFEIDALGPFTVELRSVVALRRGTPPAERALSARAPSTVVWNGFDVGSGEYAEWLSPGDVFALDLTLPTRSFGLPDAIELELGVRCERRELDSEDRGLKAFGYAGDVLAERSAQVAALRS